MKRRNPARWRAIEARLGREMTIWVATVKYNGRPHLTPVWFVWLQERLYICIQADSQKHANIYHNPSIALALPDTEGVVIFEGEANAAPREAVEILAGYFFNKYEWDFRYEEGDWRLIEVTPYKSLAWGDGYDHEGTRVF